MIYKSFETIPYKLLIEISNNRNYKLLTDDPNIEDDELEAIWNEIEAEYNERDSNDDEKRYVKIEGLSSYFECMHKVIKTGCEILKFDYNQDVANVFNEHGYYINENDFLDRIDQIERECEGLLVKADHYRESMPTPADSGNITIDDILASYCVMLSIDFDFNTVTASKVVALGKQIDRKIKSLT